MAAEFRRTPLTAVTIRLLLIGMATAGCAGAPASEAAADTAATAAATTTAGGSTGTTAAATTTVTCANNLPTACPSPAPSYKTDVVPIINAICQECHSPGGIGASVGNSGGGGGGIPPGLATGGTGTTAGTTGGSTHPGWDPSTAHDWSVYENIVHTRNQMLQDVFLCRMPPVNVQPLSDADRTTLMTWLVCGAPNN